jgi:hypothetical protein
LESEYWREVKEGRMDLRGSKIEEILRKIDRNVQIEVI